MRWITLANPGRRNAIPRHGFEILTEAFESSGQRVLVVTGAAGHFSAGVDLSDGEIAGKSAADNLRVMRRTATAATALHRLTKPTVAAVDGIAMGAGMNLALGCDIVIAGERARFAEVEVLSGLALEFGGTWLLPRLVGYARARVLALTGREVSGAEALDMGLIVRLVSSETLRAEAAAVGGDLASGAPLAQQFIKSGLSRSTGMTFEQALRFEGQAQAVLVSTEDVTEAVNASRAKRAPVFRGR